MVGAGPMGGRRGVGPLLCLSCLLSDVQSEPSRPAAAITTLPIALPPPLPSPQPLTPLAQESSSARRLEHILLRALLKRHAQLKQPRHHRREVPKEQIIILSILLHPRPEALILNQHIIRRQHHQRLGGLILILRRPLPLLPLPRLLQQQRVEVVGQHRRAEGPRALEAGAVGVAAAQGVGAGQGDDFLVVESHASEDGAQVLVPLRGVGEAPVGGAGGDVSVGAAGAVGDGGAGHLLDGGDAGEDPEVRVGDPGEFLCGGC